MEKFNKAIVLFSVVITLGVSCVCAAEISKFSKGFVKSFEDCDPYEETVQSEFVGKSFVTKRKILGWRNGFCLYQETLSSGDDKYQLDCAFTNVQLDEIYASMKSRSKEIIRYELELFADSVDATSNKKKYVSMGTTTIKGNKAFVTWAKYQNNPYFCSRKKL